MIFLFLFFKKITHFLAILLIFNLYINYFKNKKKKTCLSFLDSLKKTMLYSVLAIY